MPTNDASRAESPVARAWLWCGSSNLRSIPGLPLRFEVSDRGEECPADRRRLVAVRATNVVRRAPAAAPDRRKNIKGGEPAAGRNGGVGYVTWLSADQLSPVRAIPYGLKLAGSPYIVLVDARADNNLSGSRA